MKATQRPNFKTTNAASKCVTHQVQNHERHDKECIKIASTDYSITVNATLQKEINHSFIHHQNSQYDIKENYPKNYSFNLNQFWIIG